MSITLPTIALADLKKYPLQVLVAILLVLLGYFINSASNTSEKRQRETELRAVNAERQRDSIERELSNFKDALIQQAGLANKYKSAFERTDSITKRAIRMPTKIVIKNHKK